MFEKSKNLVQRCCWASERPQCEKRLSACINPDCVAPKYVTVDTGRFLSAVRHLVLLDLSRSADSSMKRLAWRESITGCAKVGRKSESTADRMGLRCYHNKVVSQCVFLSRRMRKTPPAESCPLVKIQWLVSYMTSSLSTGLVSSTQKSLFCTIVPLLIVLLQPACMKSGKLQIDWQSPYIAINIHLLY